MPWHEKRFHLLPPQQVQLIKKYTELIKSKTISIPIPQGKASSMVVETTIKYTS